MIQRMTKDHGSQYAIGIGEYVRYRMRTNLSLMSMVSGIPGVPVKPEDPQARRNPQISKRNQSPNALSATTS